MLLDPDKTKQWCDDIDHDIAVLQKAAIRPLAIVKRLLEIKASKRGDAMGSPYWPEFRSPVRGVSNYGIDLRHHVITLEFGYHVAAAREVYERLDAIKDEFKTITKIELHVHNIRQRASISLSIPVRNLK